MKTAILKYSVDYHTHEVKLTNRDGHSFSAKSEDLTDFISYEDNYNSKKAGIDLIAKTDNNHDRLVQASQRVINSFSHNDHKYWIEKLDELITELKA